MLTRDLLAIFALAINILFIFAADVAVYLTVTLLDKGKTSHDLSGRCAGNKPILDFIKSKIQRMFALELLNSHRRFVIRMYSRGDRDWSSPAKLFQVS